jgi:hypothetical protein
MPADDLAARLPGLEEIGRLRRDLPIMSRFVRSAGWGAESRVCLPAVATGTEPLATSMLLTLRLDDGGPADSYLAGISVIAGRTHAGEANRG